MTSLRPFGPNHHAAPGGLPDPATEPGLPASTPSDTGGSLGGIGVGMGAGIDPEQVWQRIQRGRAIIGEEQPA